MVSRIRPPPLGTCLGRFYRALGSALPQPCHQDFNPPGTGAQAPPQTHPYSNIFKAFLYPEVPLYPWHSWCRRATYLVCIISTLTATTTASIDTCSTPRSTPSTNLKTQSSSASGVFSGFLRTHDPSCLEPTINFCVSYCQNTEDLESNALLVARTSRTSSMAVLQLNTSTLSRVL